MIKGRKQQDFVAHLTNEMEKVGMDAMILTSAGGIFYSTGFAARSVYRSGKTGNAVSVITSDGRVTLICSEFEKQAAVKVCDASVHIEAYPVWIYIEDYAYEGMTKEVQPDLNRTYRIAAQFIDMRVGNVKVGVESKWINYEAGVYLREVFGAANIVDCTKAFNEARVIKTDWEIEVLKYNAQAAEVAMNRTAKALVPGMSTADIHRIFFKFCEELVPELTTVSMSHTVGSDFAPAWMPCETNRIKCGDLVRLDGGPYSNGYKADLGRTYAVGGYTSANREKLYADLWKGYEWAVNNMGPGMRMCDVFHGVQDAIGMKNYVRGHHGHSISCDISGEEAPFFSPEETRVLEPGMVLCIETPFYSSSRHTYNIEDTFVVTDSGIELFSHANPSMYI